MGGTVITELDSQGQKRKGFVYCNGQLIARQEHLWIVWQHDDPFTGARAGSNRDGAGAVDLDPDPMGVDLGSADPYVEPQLWEPPPEGMVGLLPGSGIPSGRCMLDGMSIECRQAGHLLQIGAAEFEHPTTVWDNGSWHFVEFNPKTGEYETRIDEERLDAGGRELIDYLKRKIDSSANHVVRQFGLYYSISQNPQNPAPHEPAAGQTLSQADCDKKIAAIFGGPGAVAATVNEPSTLQHPSAGRDRYDHLAGNGVFHLYTNAQGTEGTVGLYTPSGFIGRPVTGTVYNGPNDPSPGEVNYNYERFTYRGGLQISFVHAGNPGVNRNDRNAMGSVRVGNIAGPGGEGAGYNHTHVNVYLNGKRVDPRSIFCK
jgi:hypothetical protein